MDPARVSRQVLCVLGRTERSFLAYGNEFLVKFLLSVVVSAESITLACVRPK